MAGELLKKRREELGLDRKEISALLKIREDYLASIEEDCFDRLPVAVYTIGYIRCYAAYLNIEPEPIISYYTGHLTEPKPSTILPIASSKKKMPVSYYIIPALVAVLIVLGIVVFRQGRTAQENTAAPVVDKPVQKQPETVKPSEVAVAPEPPKIPQPQMPQPAALPVQPAAIKSPAADSHNLEVTAKEMTWMHISFSDGKYEEMTLRPGMSRTWLFNRRATLKLGNAGGVRLRFDNRDMGAPGSSGQVITLSLPEDRKTDSSGQ